MMHIIYLKIIILRMYTNLIYVMHNFPDICESGWIVLEMVFDLTKNENDSGML